MIELHDATVTVASMSGDVTILHPTSLTLSEPRISIIGGNGSGKSTLARLLNGLIVPSSGSVTVHTRTAGATGTAGTRDATVPAGTAPKPLDTRDDGAAVRRAVGFVFTDPSAQLIMPTVIEDVSLSLRRQYRDKHQRHAAALATLERFGLHHLANQSVHSLSGGQKQMLAITSVLTTDPAILVADEPTTLLDLRNSRLIGDLLMSLPQQVCVVTHDLDLAARADRTLVVESGRVVFDGNPTEAIAHYRALA